MKKIVYFANLTDTINPTIDQEIEYSLKKVAEVKSFDIKNFKIEELIEEANKSDLFLLHGKIEALDEATFYLLLERIRVILENITCKKVLWILDKIWTDNIKIVISLLGKVDYIFVNDETWLRRFESDKIFPLHSATPEIEYKGEFKQELACDIAMVCNLYGRRLEFFEFVKGIYGDKFKVFDDKYGQDFADLCKSAKIILIPKYPFDDFYWSDMIYRALSNGAFVICPTTEGLREEGLIEKQHYINYCTYTDLKVAIDMFLVEEETRNKIANEGQKVSKGITYSKRLKEIFNKLKQNESKG